MTNKNQLTNAKIVTILQSFQDETGQNLLKKKLPVKLLFAIKRNLNIVSDAYKIYEETLQSLATQYGAELGQKSIKAKNPEDQSELNQRVLELLNEKVDLKFHLVAPEVIEDYDENTYDSLTFEEIERLDWFIEE